MNSLTSVNPNLAFWLERRAVLQPDQEGIIYWHSADDAERWTYRRLNESAKCLASWMLRQGVKPGDRVAFLDFNDARFTVAMFAAARIGAIFVPLNFRLSAPEIVSTVNDCDAKLLIYGDQFAGMKEAVAAQCNCTLYVLSSRDRHDEFEPIVGGAVTADVPLAVSEWDEPAWLLYTSGSTGQPKGVILSYGNVLWNTINIILIQGGFADDRVLISAPLFHAAPVATLMESFLRGALIHLERSFDAERLLRRISEERINIVAGVPAMYKLMAAHETFEATDLSALRAVVVGGAPVPDVLIAQYRKREVAVIQRYGLTEAAPLVTALPPGSPIGKQMTAGLPAIFGDLRLRGPEGIVTTPGQIGEIEAAGPNIMQGYWKRELETREALCDGWLRTGDLGTIDADGYLTVVGRSKDMIISGGENVYAAEVEARLVENPAILESAVIGVPDEKWGEIVCAIISLKGDQPATAEEVIAHLQGRLARYKHPKKVIFIDALPKNGAGKIDKLRLKKEYGGLPQVKAELENN
jgi:fatty-acyl-CoA synthase